MRPTIVVGGRTYWVTLHDVLYAPDIMCNMVTAAKVRKHGFRITANGDMQNEK